MPFAIYFYIAFPLWVEHSASPLDSELRHEILLWVSRMLAHVIQAMA